MSNTALSSARRRRTGPVAPVMAASPQVQQQQQLQQQRLLEIQRQKQLLPPQQPQQLQQTQQLQPPYTQRMQAPMQAPMQRVITPQAQTVKADTPVPPGYIKLLMPNGVYQMESVETGSINFPYAEPHLAPTLILRNHDLDIIKLQGYHNDVSNQLAHLTTLVSRVTSNPVRNDMSGSNGIGGDVSTSTTTVDAEDDGGIEEQEIVFDEAVIHKITENPAFIANTVSHIMQNTNLSDLVTEVNTVKTENRELRSILNSQHEMMNAMNLLLFKLLNKMHSSPDDNVQNELVETVEPEITLPNEPQELEASQEPQEHKENNLSTIEEEEDSSQLSSINTEPHLSGIEKDIPRDWLP